VVSLNMVKNYEKKPAPSIAKTVQNRFFVWAIQVHENPLNSMWHNGPSVGSNPTFGTKDSSPQLVSVGGFTMGFGGRQGPRKGPQNAAFCRSLALLRPTAGPIAPSKEGQSQGQFLVTEFGNGSGEVFRGQVGISFDRHLDIRMAE